MVPWPASKSASTALVLSLWRHLDLLHSGPSITVLIIQTEVTACIGNTGTMSQSFKGYDVKLTSVLLSAYFCPQPTLITPVSVFVFQSGPKSHRCRCLGPHHFRNLFKEQHERKLQATSHFPLSWWFYESNSLALSLNSAPSLPNSELSLVEAVRHSPLTWLGQTTGPLSCS